MKVSITEVATTMRTRSELEPGPAGWIGEDIQSTWICQSKPLITPYPYRSKLSQYFNRTDSNRLEAFPAETKFAEPSIGNINYGAQEVHLLCRLQIML